jgi:hypothetical protein
MAIEPGLGYENTYRHVGADNSRSGPAECTRSLA